MKGISMITNFALNSAKFLDERQGLAETLEGLNIFGSTVAIPDGFEVYVKSEKAWFTYDADTAEFAKRASALATVATSGSYNDLSDKPTIPSTEGFVKNESGAFDYDNLTNKPTIPTMPGAATESANGLMSSADKVKLDGLNKVENIEVSANTIEVNPANLLTNVEYNGTHDAVTFQCVAGGIFNQPCIVLAVKNTTANEVAVAMPDTFGGWSVISTQGVLSITVPAGGIVEFNLLCTNGVIRVVVL